MNVKLSADVSVKRVMFLSSLDEPLMVYQLMFPLAMRTPARQTSSS